MKIKGGTQQFIYRTDLLGGNLMDIFLFLSWVLWVFWWLRIFLGPFKTCWRSRIVSSKRMPDDKTVGASKKTKNTAHQLTEDTSCQDKALSDSTKLHHILPLISCLRPFCKQHPLNTHKLGFCCRRLSKAIYTGSFILRYWASVKWPRAPSRVFQAYICQMEQMSKSTLTWQGGGHFWMLWT